MKQTGRSHLLEALCILSFIGSGIGFLMYTTVALFFGSLYPFIAENMSVPGNFTISGLYFLGFGLLFGISFLGVFLMWKLRKQGFFVYAVARAAIVAYPLLLMGDGAFSAVVVIFSLLFTGLYASQLKRMRYHSLDD